MTEENNGAAVALPEPDQEQRWYCNKCGETGVGNGFNHMRQSGFLCAYSAVATGPFFATDKMLAFRAEGEADLRARLAAAEAEVVRLRAYAECENARTGSEDIAETVLKRHGWKPAVCTAQEFMDSMRRATLANLKEQAA